ncbi:MAG: helicase-associated domain-containing protein [Specibacter sp.]
MSTLAALAADLADRSDAELVQLLRLRPDAMAPPVANFAGLASRLSTAHSVDLALDRLNLPQLQVLAALAAGDAAEEHTPWLPELHALALLVAAEPAHNQQKHDGGTRHLLPLASAGSSLGRKAPAGDTPGPAFAGPLRSQPPAATTLPVPLRIRDNAAGSAMETLLRNMTGLVELAGHTPMESLRSGALGVRTVRKLAGTLQINEAQLCFYLELAAMAQLIRFDSSALRWRAAAAGWLELDRTAQWLALVRAWQDSDRKPTPSTPLSPALPFSPLPQPEAAKAPAAARPLTPAAGHPHARTLRRNVLSAVRDLAVTPAASATAPTAARAPVPQSSTSPAPDAASVLALLHWRHPRQLEELSKLVPDILHEMELLGLTGAGTLSDPGRAVSLGNWDAAGASLHLLLPAPIEHFVIQGDLTAVAPGFLAPAVAARLKLLASTEGQGAAGIFRFSQTSLEAAMAAGLDSNTILAFLRRHSSTAVPQSLEYLVTAAARRTGERSEPTGPTAPALAGSAPAQPASKRNPVSAVVPPRPEGSKRARGSAGAGYFERADGSMPWPSEAEVTAQISRLRSEPVWAADDGGESGPSRVMEQLRQAIEAGADVWLQVVDGAGERERLLLRPISLVAGTLRARPPGSSQERRFSIHRIMAAEQAASSETGRTSPPEGKAHHG